jgi:hypothetical protein
MRTVDLVSLLAADAAPVAAKAVARRLALSVAWGLPLALLLMGLTLGPRSDLAQAALGGPFWMKVGFAACLAWAGFLAVERLGRPGMRVGGVWFALAAPLLLAWLVAAFVVLQAEPAQRNALILGSSWRSCSFNIAWISLPIFAAVFWAMRGLAPTRLALAGAGAGVLAGSLGALVYALHCPESAEPFLAVWYLLGIAMPTLAGAFMGPRWLRW